MRIHTAMPTSKHMGFQKSCEFQNQCPVCHHLFTAGAVTAVGNETFHFLPVHGKTQPCVWTELRYWVISKKHKIHFIALRHKVYFSQICI